EPPRKAGPRCPARAEDHRPVAGDGEMGTPWLQDGQSADLGREPLSRERKHVRRAGRVGDHASPASAVRASAHMLSYNGLVMDAAHARSASWSESRAALSMASINSSSCLASVAACARIKTIPRSVNSNALAMADNR